MIRLLNVNHCFYLGDVSVPALVDIDLKIAQGEIMAIAGPSGSGKTTLLNVIGCLLTPDSGTVNLFGKEIFPMTDAERSKIRRERIGFIFQSFNLIPVLSAFENVEYPLILNRIGKNKRYKRVNDLLYYVGMSKHRQHKPEQLSGGQRQRVAIARAIAANPSVVLADEPTANLDTNTAHEILVLLNDLNKEFNTCIIFATHDAKVSAMSQREIRMQDGRLVS